MPSKKHKLMISVLSVLFLIIFKYVVDNIAGSLPLILQLFAHGSLSIAGGLITLSSCSLLGTLSDAEDRGFSRLLERISESPERNFFAGFLVTAYFNSIRPALAASLYSLPYMEWISLALAIYMVHTNVGLSAKEPYIEDTENLGWKKHAQEVRREIGLDLTRIAGVLQKFVDYGTKEPLLVYLTLYLQRLGETEEGVLKILEPLIDYRENARGYLDVLSFPWTKKKIALRRRRAREVFLKTFMDKLIGRG